MILVIVESPGKVKKIQGILGSGYTVVATRGHLLGLPARGYGFDRKDLAKDFDVKYVPLASRAGDIARLRAAARAASRVIVATDGDREGAAIGFHALALLGIDWRSAQRAVFFEITKTAITRAIAAPVPMDHPLYEAQQARRLVDRVVGYLASPAVRRHVQGGQSAGRCQSVALALVSDRDAAATTASQRPPDVRTSLQLGGTLCGISAQVTTKNTSCTDTILRTWVAAAMSRDGIVVSDKPSVKQATRHPPPAFTTSTVLQAAGSALGLSPKSAMAMLQSLYTAGHITYHRTDSVALAPSFVLAAGRVVAETYGQAMVTPRYYRRNVGTNTTAQEAHEAIRPTRAGVTAVRGASTALYALVRRRALATQCRPERSETVLAQLCAPGAPSLGVATLSARRVLDPGFRSVSTKRTASGDEDPRFQHIVSLCQGDRMHVDRVVCAEQLPPVSRPRFTESTLVAELERVGVGRPSTYSTIVRTIKDRGYVVVADAVGTPVVLSTLTLSTAPDAKVERTTRQEMRGTYRRRLVPTQSGRATVAYLRERFPVVVDASFTATVEGALDHIASGALPWRNEVRRVWAAMEPLARAERKRGRAHKAVASPPTSIGSDPVTGHPIYVYTGRYGPVVRLGAETKSAKYANLPKGLSIDRVDLSTAIFLLSLPKKLSESVVLKHGRFGFYVEQTDVVGSKKKPTTRTVSGGLRAARALTLRRAVALLDQPRKPRARGKRHRKGTSTYK